MPTICMICDVLETDVEELVALVNAVSKKDLQLVTIGFNVKVMVAERLPFLRETFFLGTVDNFRMSVLPE